MPAFVKALNKVDLPTFGSPTIPHFKLMSVPVSEARKCMPWAMARLLVACFALLWCVNVVAAPQPPSVLRDEMGGVEALPLARAWFDAEGDATLQQVLRDADALFRPAEPGAVQ